MRSAAKPLQALPLVAYDLPPGWRSRAPRTRPGPSGSSPCALLEPAPPRTTSKCGAEHGSKLRHNCWASTPASSSSVARGWKTRRATAPAHPLQQEILALVAERIGRPQEAISTAVDGCGTIPRVRALTLTEMARLFADLVRGEPEVPRSLVAAVTAQPELVGGPQAMDTLVMRALPGAVAKRGAERECSVSGWRTVPAWRSRSDEAYRAAYAAAGPCSTSRAGRAPAPLERGEVVGSISATG